MPLVKKVISYQVLGKSFKNTTDIKIHIENEIGAMLDKVSPRLPSKQATQLLNLIIDNRKGLTNLLNTEIDVSENPLIDDLRNILD